MKWLSQYSQTAATVTIVKFKHLQCPKRRLPAMSRGSLSFPKFSNKESTSESMIFLSWVSYISGIKRHAALCEWLQSLSERFRLILQHVNYISVLHFLNSVFAFPKCPLFTATRGLWTANQVMKSWFRKDGLIFLGVYRYKVLICTLLVTFVYYEFKEN